MIGLRNCGHLGRVGDWAEMAAAAGQVSLHFLNTSGAQRVAPFGGSDRRLSTNPISIGVPVAGGDPVILDVTTSTVAEGKLMVALNKGEQVPDGWIIDRDGRRRPIPKAFYDGGALLTIGAHKGSGLSIVTDLLAGALSTGRSSDPDDTVLRNNMLSIYIAPAVYAPEGAVAREAARFVDWVKASPPRKQGEPVHAPGDVERRTRAERAAQRRADRRQDVVGSARRGEVGRHRCCARCGDRRALNNGRALSEQELFPGFTTHRVRTADTEIRCVVGGDGPPVLLLHGYPQTHAMWHRVAPALARHYTVVCADLRGYGDSGKPASDDAHAAYSKRAMAQDMVELMRDLGHRAFPAGRP